MRDFFWMYGQGRCERRARKRARRFVKHVARAWRHQYPVWMDERAAEEYMARRALRRMWLLFAMIEFVSRLFGRRHEGVGGQRLHADDDGWNAPVTSADWWPSRRRAQPPRTFLPQQSAPIVSRASAE